MLIWHPVFAGALAMSPRPALRAIPELHEQGVQHVVSCMGRREQIGELGAVVRSSGMVWHWLEIPRAQPPQGRDEARILRQLDQLELALGRGEHVMVHCAAGIHRSGMIAYALLSRSGLDHRGCVDAIRHMRSVAVQYLQGPRIAWAAHQISVHARYHRS